MIKSSQWLTIGALAISGALLAGCSPASKSEPAPAPRVSTPAATVAPTVEPTVPATPAAPSASPTPTPSPEPAKEPTKEEKPQPTPETGKKPEDPKKDDKKPADNKDNQAKPGDKGDKKGDQDKGKDASKPPAGENNVQVSSGLNSDQGGPNCAEVKCVALTFDDGPGEYTAATLDALKKAGVKATFFVMGKNVIEHPDLVKREAQEGNAVGNHSWNHPQLTQVSNKGLGHQILDTNNEIKKILGVGTHLMRPPYGAVNHRVRNYLAENQQAVILWDVDTLDWKHKNVDKAMEFIRQEVKPGGIILMHDIHPVAPKVVPIVVAELKKQGYHFVTIPQLFADKGLIPGAKHFGHDQILK
ncbi:hypothetical protein BK816_08350 [Boudabousia tangfeifanii]|uniref:NodB homology domain-containing protein n=1 Tax=Boudabousia tangfeifanii TaxID=1912795 RepID=A0A1D9MLW5_9ACTO|nr:polysaccharide deacetylase family protein [Boudabousia tangfeifanii]AOZ73286.1 hypothetical protein BK816_08350 [Boudabousia tangfeifanii]